MTVPPDPDSSIPPDAQDTPDEWGWSRPQRMGLGCMLFLLLLFLTIQYTRRPFLLNDPAVIVRGERITLPTRTDPNTATALELTRIPHLGDKLAAKIIDYRERRKPLTPEGIVFHTPEDLSHIPGLGTKTLEQLRPYLQFPDDAETQPATPPDQPQ